MVVIEKTGKTADEAVEAALQELHVSRDQVEVEILEASKTSLFGIFGNRREAKVKVTVKDDVKATPEQTVPVEAAPEKASVEAPAVHPEVEEGSALDSVKLTADSEEAVLIAREFLQKLLKEMKYDAVMEKFYNKTEKSTTFKLHGPGMGALIGKHGQTLDALQYLTNLVANKHSQERVRIIVDVENYRQRRRETLERLAKRLADKVKRTSTKAVLEPMNPYERKIIHMTLQDDPQVTTYSEGEEPYRKTVIDLK